MRAFIQPRNVPAMALRGDNGVLGVYTRAGTLCLAPAGETCIAHGLPEAPDTFYYQPLIGAAGSCTTGIYVQSWNGSIMTFYNSINQGIRGYLTAQVIHSSQE